MMLYPPMADLVDKVGSRYMLVNVVAHRARQLAIKEEDPELATGKEGGRINDCKSCSIQCNILD